MSNSERIDFFSDEIKDLIISAQKDDEKALNKLVEINTPLVNSIIKKYNSKVSEYEDLFQIGAIGLIKAIRKFNFEFNTKFSTYAVYVIDGEIRKHFRDEGMIKISRSIKTTYLKARKVREEYVKLNGVEPTVEYIGEKIDVSIEEVVTCLDACRRPESLNASIGEDSKKDLIDKIEDEKQNNDIIIEKIDLKNAINNLEKRDRQIIVLRYFQNKTQSEVAKMLGLSQVQVSRLEKKIIESIKNTI